MNIGIIGAGEMGSCLALKFVGLNYNVFIANSRGPESLKQVARHTGATPVTVEEATDNKHIIVISIPQKNIADLPQELFKKLSSDVIVIDTGNYYPTLRDGNIPELQQSGIDSLWVQQQLSLPIVKVFNSILATSLQHKGRPKGSENRIAMALSGGNEKSKRLVSQLVDDIGFDPFDVGSIYESWKQQPGTPIYCRDISLEEMRRRVASMGAWDNMRDITIAQRSADEILMKKNYSAYLSALAVG